MFKKFYKETLTVEEYSNFEKLLKQKKSEITELESVVKKMKTYSDQYDYERIMAMSEAEFDYIRDSIIEAKKDEIRKHNKDIDEQNRTINGEINSLLEENIELKKELEEITNEIGSTGKYTKEEVKPLNVSGLTNPKNYKWVTSTPRVIKLYFPKNTLFIHIKLLVFIMYLKMVMQL